MSPDLASTEALLEDERRLWALEVERSSLDYESFLGSARGENASAAGRHSGALVAASRKLIRNSRTLRRAAIARRCKPA